MKNKKTKDKIILIVSNCTWYLYNFRKELLRDLNEKGFKLILLSPIDKYYLEISHLFSKKENLFLVRGSENPILEIITLLNLFFIYSKYKPDLVHHFTIKPCIYGGIISRILGIKNTINHITGLGPSFYSRRIKINILNKILNPIYKFAFNNSSNNILNIFHNSSDRNTFFKKNITSLEQSIVIQGSGVNTDHYKKVASKKLLKKDIQILFPARIIKEKGIVELVNACNDLWYKNYKFTLNIAGEIDKQNKSHLNKGTIDNLLRSKNIIFHEKCNNMLEIYRNMDIVVLPSWREGLSKSILEAAAMSIPIITTNVPGCNDIIEHGYSGLLVDVKNKDMIREAIKIFLEDPKTAETLANNARKTVVKKFKLEIINKKILKIYDKFLSQ
tara:strand:+ start:2307 stop:3467 length:1161 start_codon:yes stop_codon:yes gene_type:complete